MKHKRKPKPKCPFGHIYGQDGIDKKECGKCPIAESCGTKSFYYAQKIKDKQEEKRKRKDDDFRRDTHKHKNITESTIHTGCEDKPPKSKKHKRKSKQQTQDHRSLLIPPESLQKMLNLPTPHNTNCIAMYNFVLKEGIRQKTNKPYCTDNFIAGKKRKGLKWDLGRVKTTKRWLIKLGLIREVQERDAKGHFKKKYLEIVYFPSKFTIENAEYLNQLDEDVEEFAEWCNTFTSERMKMEIAVMKWSKRASKWKAKYTKLKNLGF